MNSFELKDDAPLTKLEIAQLQLERALLLFLDDADYVCAITLAGAGEEILGRLLQAEGRQSSLKNFVDCCMAIDRMVDGNPTPEKVFVTMANSFRDGLKHYTDGLPISVPQQAAVEILDRAISNFWAVTGTQTSTMLRFITAVHG